jgi:hypothetical protein
MPARPFEVDIVNCLHYARFECQSILVRDLILRNDMWNPVEKGLSLVVSPQISPFRGPLYFARLNEPARGAAIVDQGGFGLVSTGNKKLLVTCNHVWEGFLKAKENDPNLRLHLCFNLERKQPFIFDVRNPLDQDKSLDIAVFDMEPVLALCAGLKFYPLDQNPPPHLKRGDWIIVLGNQGMNRPTNTESLEFGLTIYALPIADVDQHGQKFHVEKISKLKIRRLHAPARPPQNNPHGGISGSPCFLLTPGPLCKLVGFVTEFGFDCLRFTHASCLKLNGTINKC